MTASTSDSADLDDDLGIVSKIRTIDPEVRTINGPLSLSDLDPEWAQRLMAYRESRRKPNPIETKALRTQYRAERP